MTLWRRVSAAVAYRQPIFATAYCVDGAFQYCNTQARCGGPADGSKGTRASCCYPEAAPRDGRDTQLTSADDTPCVMKMSPSAPTTAAALLSLPGGMMWGHHSTPRTQGSSGAARLKQPYAPAPVECKKESWPSHQHLSFRSGFLHSHSGVPWG